MKLATTMIDDLTSPPTVGAPSLSIYRSGRRSNDLGASSRARLISVLWDIKRGESHDIALRSLEHHPDNLAYPAFDIPFDYGHDLVDVSSSLSGGLVHKSELNKLGRRLNRSADLSLSASGFSQIVSHLNVLVIDVSNLLKQNIRIGLVPSLHNRFALDGEPARILQLFPLHILIRGDPGKTDALSARSNDKGLNSLGREHLRRERHFKPSAPSDNHSESKHRPLHRDTVLLIHEATKTLAPTRVAELAKGLGLDLSNTLSGHIEILANFLKSMVTLLSDTETHSKNLLLSRS